MHFFVFIQVDFLALFYENNNLVFYKINKLKSLNSLTIIAVTDIYG